MDLLFTITAYPPSIGGAQYHFHSLARELSKKNSIQVLSHWDENRTDWLLGTTVFAPTSTKEYEIDSIDVTRFGFSPIEKCGLAPWVGLYPFFQGIAIDQISAAIFHKFKKIVPKVTLIHNCRVGREGISYASLKLARQQNVPFFITPVHHPRWSSWFHRYYHKIYREADGVIVLTPSEKKTLIDLGVKEERVFVTGIGPILSEQYSAEQFRADNGIGAVPMVLFLGQKYEYKGFKSILEATQAVWEKIPEVCFVFVGPRTEYSKKIFSSVHDERIIELGSVDLQTKTNALAACDLFCLPSTQESFGGVFTEAWSMRKPVIGGKIPAIQDVIEDGVDGMWTEQSANEMAEKIIYLLSNQERSSQMGQAGFDKVRNLYTWEKIGASTDEAYKNVLNGSYHASF